MAREDLARRVAQLAGADAVEIISIGTGWPSLFRLEVEGVVINVAAHVSNVSPHARRAYEWRFQNPATRTPVAAPPGYLPLLIGLDTSGPIAVLVVADGRSRVGRVARFSILFDHRISVEAAQVGWSEYQSSSGETIYAVRPQLIPALVQVIRSGAQVPSLQIANAIDMSGMLEGDDEAPNRLRRMVSSYVRRARFGSDVRAAYANRCAFCEVGLGLTAGAHIYPVSAPGSTDNIWNGIALCHNHHSAFDRHQIWVNSDYSLRISAHWRAEANNEASARFIAQTRPTMVLPADAHQRPRRDMLVARYQHYGLNYEWAPAVT